MTLADKIEEFIEGRGTCEYINRYGVKIEVLDHVSFAASYILIEGEKEKGKGYRLVVEFSQPKKQFLKTLQVKSALDLNRITPQALLNLYEIGTAQLVCFVSLVYLYCMTFEKWNDKIIATSDNCFHQAKGGIEKPEQYVDYTRQYYTLIKDYSYN